MMILSFLKKTQKRVVPNSPWDGTGGVFQTLNRMSVAFRHDHLEMGALARLFEVNVVNSKVGVVWF